MSSLNFRKRHSDDLLSDLRRFDFKKYLYFWGFIFFLFVFGFLFYSLDEETAFWIIVANDILISMIVLILMIMEIIKKYTSTMAINALTKEVRKYGYDLNDVEEDYKTSVVVRNINDMFIFGDRYLVRFGFRSFQRVI